ncbi:MAG: FlgD immunoglobulin-like domain containing protein [Candidatus Neomarinimicrobiota bacterium]
MIQARHFGLAALFVALSPLRLPGQGDTTFAESFDDGNLTENPVWTRFYADECPDCIALDDTQYVSPLYSLKISTVDQFSAIESFTGLYDASLPFEFTTSVYVASMGEEAIPCLMRGANTVLALFLLRDTKTDILYVQLDVLKDTTVWLPETLIVSPGYALNTWHTFTIRYNGRDTTTLYIDNAYQGEVVQPLREAPFVIQLGNRYVRHTSTFYVDDMLITTTLPEPVEEPGKVYLILGSDTGTWDGLNVYQHDNYYRFGLFSDPDGNGARVIDPAFRAQLRDSYDEPLVFTWWLIGGNMMVYNTNPEVEYPWISNLEMIRKYRGQALEAVGDELALHYHNWIWSDPDGNGTFHWNQSVDLGEYREDFLETIGRMFLEGDLMPTSFRSGWHYMSNKWSVLIDSLIPYRLENDVPHVHDDTQEPLDNIYDWSRAPLEWVPYHPDAQDYQSPGDLRGWESRSIHMSSVDFGLLYNVFMRAYYGTDQVMTIWSHLPEADFPQQIIRVDSLVKMASKYFPDVLYDYVTATGGMQKWRGLADDMPPTVTLEVVERGDTVEVTATSDEPIWQVAPLTYADGGGEHLIRLFPDKVAPLTWKVVFNKSVYGYREIGFAMTDTSGNAAVEKVQFEVVSIAGGPGERLPATFGLHPAYPNPFNPATAIRFDLPAAAAVKLVVYDLLGRVVVVLVDGPMEAGYHHVIWNGTSGDGREMPTGVYIARLLVPQYAGLVPPQVGALPRFTGSIKLVLLK